AQFVVAAGEAAIRAIVYEAANEEVEKTVVIEIEPYRAGGPMASKDARAQTGLLTYIGECTVPIVVIKNGPSVGSYEKIGKAIVVVVPGCHAHAECSPRHTGTGGHIRESAVTIVLIQCIPNGFGRFVEVAWTAVYQVDIHPPIVIVVEEGAPGTHGFRK